MRTRGPIVTYYNQPNGLGHAKATVKKMAGLAQQGAHTYAIRSLATRITRNVPSKDVRGELAALYVWVRDQIRYRFDPLGLEWVQSPERTIKEGAGDCDDMATLLASLCQSLGHKTRFATVGATPERQEHVYVQAFDGRAWVTLDPVLEKRQPTAAARPNDLGDFARTAPGSQRLYDDGGNMLGFIPNARERQLWIFTPWETNKLSRLANLGPDRRYRSDSTTGGPPRGYVRKLLPGEVDTSQADELGRIPYYDPELQLHGFLQSLGKGLKSIGKVVGTVASVAGPIISSIPGVPPGVGQGLSMAGGLLKAVTRNGQKVKAGPATGQFHNVGQSSVQPTAAPTMTPGPQGFPVPAHSTQDLAPLLQTMSTVTNRAMSEIASLAHGTQDARIAAARRAGARHQAKIEAKRRAKARKKPQKLKRAYDAKTKQWIYYRPATLHGISITLGGVTPPTAAQRQLATEMVNALEGYQAKTGKPLYGPGVHVWPFQRAVPGLKVDGEYGPNVRLAASWALGVSTAALPRVAPQYERYDLTWQPPSTPDASPAKKPAPAQHKPAPARPAPSKPAPQKPAAPAPQHPASTGGPSPQLIAAYKQAVAHVRTFIAGDRLHRPPEIAIAAVRAAQNLSINETITAHPEYTLKQRQDIEALRPTIADGLWGPMMRLSASNVLHVPESSLPPIADAFMHPSHKTAPAKPTHKDKPAHKEAPAKPEHKTAPAKPTHKDKPAHKEAITQADIDRAVAAAVAAAAAQARKELKTITQADVDNAVSKAIAALKAQHKTKTKKTTVVDIHSGPPTAAKKTNDKTWLTVAALYYLSRRRAA